MRWTARRPWIQQGIMQGLVVGSLFYQLNDDAFASKFAFFFFLVVQAFFFNMVEGSMAFEYKSVSARAVLFPLRELSLCAVKRWRLRPLTILVLPLLSCASRSQIAEKQVTNKFYSAFSYVWAGVFAHLPFTFSMLLLFYTYADTPRSRSRLPPCVLLFYACLRRVSSLAYLCRFACGSVSYFMAGMSYDAQDYFLFIALVFTVDGALAAVFRLCVYIAPTVIMAEVRSLARHCGRSSIVAVSRVQFDPSAPRHRRVLARVVLRLSHPSPA
jgi:hypothetical protein